MHTYADTHIPIGHCSGVAGTADASAPSFSPPGRHNCHTLRDDDSADTPVVDFRRAV